jgi:hypothetical protein
VLEHDRFVVDWVLDDGGHVIARPCRALEGRQQAASRDLFGVAMTLRDSLAVLRVAALALVVAVTVAVTVRVVMPPDPSIAQRATDQRWQEQMFPRNPPLPGGFQ